MSCKVSLSLPHTMQSLTETSNPLTQNIDVASPEGVLRLLRQTDAQLFAGYGTYPGLYDASCVKMMERVVARAQVVLRSGGHVILAGCGTSGRLAHLTCVRFNAAMGRSVPHFHYLMAGGDRALIRAQELAEDNPQLGRKDLADLLERLASTACEPLNILYVGITCGLSAPYVAAHLEWCMEALNTSPSCVCVAGVVLIGFNTVERARGKFFRHVVERFATRSCSDDRCVVLTPVVGPEAITGSTRLKGGTATKMLLDLIFAQAIAAEVEDVPRPHLMSATAFLIACELTCRYTYQVVPALAPVVQAAGRALRSEKHLAYIGDPVTSQWGLIDASECPPTFGADFGDVRGYVWGGWATVHNHEGDLTHAGDCYRISVSELALDALSDGDVLVVVLMIERNVHKNDEIIHTYATRAAATKQAGGWVGLVLVAEETGTQEIVEEGLRVLCDEVDHVVRVTVPFLYALPLLPTFGELAVKWILNAVSTGAHIARGKVIENYMADVRISNDKLFHRAVNIVARFARAETRLARSSLIRAIYLVDDTETVDALETEEAETDHHHDPTVARHIAASSDRTRVVPLAILLASGTASTVSVGQEMLKRDPIVRNVLAGHITR